MVEKISYPNQQIIRKDAGSGTPENFIFSQQALSISIENLDATDGSFFAFDTTAGTGSTSGFIPAGKAIELDLTVGSVSFLGSGGTTPEIQLMRLA